MYAEVILSKAIPTFDKIYHYKIPEVLEGRIAIGHQVIIPFGKRNTIGYVVGFAEKADVPENLIKKIIDIKAERPLFHEEALKLAKWMSNYYGSYFISALRAVMPPGTGEKEKRKNRDVSSEGVSAGQSQAFIKLPLTLAQQQALELINSSPKQTILLYGITGSGKTEVYIQAINNVLKKNQGAIVLVPEISLTPQLVSRFAERFNSQIAVLHSGLTIKERDNEWQRITCGEAKIALGARSAVFAPVKNLGIVILDEEYEQTYKQEKNPRYHTRDVAQQLGATVILGSATPSVETFYKAQIGEYKLAILPERIEKRPMPPVELIDMRKEKDHLLSAKLRAEIANALSRNEKVILFINRRGFFTFSMCRECGHTIGCPRCSVSLVYHLDDKKLLCGHCGFEAEAAMVCPKCRNSSMRFVGIGTQRIEKEVADVYREAKIIRLDRDAVSKRGSHEKIFAAFSGDEANVLIGTQMVTKGLDIANVTLVGVVAADTTLNLPDFRAAEMTFQQITQVAGRAGRHHLPGKVIVQSHNPEHYALKYAVNHDYDGFYKEEIEHRKALFYPPFSKLINIILSCRVETKVLAYSKELQTRIAKICGQTENTLILGPAKAPISKLRGQYRYQILIKCADIGSIKDKLFKSLKESPLPRDIRINIDIDPMNLL